MIRRLILLALFLCLLPGAALACGSIGVKLGMGFHSMKGVEGEGVDAGNVFRGSVGFFARQHLGGFFFLQPGLIYISRGVSKSYSYTESGFTKPVEGGGIAKTEDASEKVKLGYLQIPVMIRYEFPERGRITPSVMLGPSFSINVSGKDELNGFGDWDGDYDIGNLKRLDMGGLIGGGVSFLIGDLRFGVDIMYDRSFTSAFKDVSKEDLANDVDGELWTKTDPVTFERTTQAVDFINTGFALQVDMMLPLGKKK